MSVCGVSINGRLTGYGVTAMSSYEDAKPYRSEINANNSWNVNFNDGNVNNNNISTTTTTFDLARQMWNTKSSFRLSMRLMRTV